MKKRKPSKYEQIESLIHAEGYELTMKYAGRASNGRPRYAEVFNVTKKEMEEYLKNHYKFSELPFIHSSPNSSDGIYIIPVSVGYRVYYQERSIHFEEMVLKTEEDVWKWYVDYKLLRSGTGLEFQ